MSLLFLRPIKRIKSRDPDDPMSPFYKSSGGPLRPLATLTIQKLREYKKACSSPEEPESLVFHEPEEVNDISYTNLLGLLAPLGALAGLEF